MKAYEISSAADLGRPDQRLYDLLQKRHLAITNRLWRKSLDPLETACWQFCRSLADGFKAVFRECDHRKTVSGSYITLHWKDRTEVTVKLDDHSNTYRDHNRAPWLQCQRVNDHRRRMQLRPNETPEQIVVRVMAHFRNTDSCLASTLPWKLRGEKLAYDIPPPGLIIACESAGNTFQPLAPNPVTVTFKYGTKRRVKVKA